MKNQIKNKAGLVFWRDIIYSDRKKYPGTPPFIEISFGMISLKDKKFVTVGTNCGLDEEKSFKISDGIVIPRRSIIKIVYLKNLNDWKEIK